MDFYLGGRFLDCLHSHKRRRHLYSTNHSRENEDKRTRSLDRVCPLGTDAFHLREISVVICKMV